MGKTERSTKRQALQTGWKGHALQVLVKGKSTNVKLCKLDGKVTSSRFWSNAAPNVKLCKPDGKVTPFRFWSKAKTNVKLCKLDGRGHALQVLVKRREQKSSFANRKERSRPPGSGQRQHQTSSFANWMERSRPSGSGSKAKANVKLCKPHGKVTIL